MGVVQGEVYWYSRLQAKGSEQAGRRPHVVIQNNAANASGVRTTMICPITTNIQRASSPGNVRLEAGEGNLLLASVVNVSQVVTVDKSELNELIGKLSSDRVRQIVTGVKSFIEPREPRAPVLDEVPT